MIGAASDALGRRSTRSFSNAGLGMAPCPLADTDVAFFDRVFHVNVRSVFLGAKHAVRAMRRQGRGGSIIVTASTAALRPRPNLAVYNATKGALVPMCKALALEVANDEIRVNGICPVAGETAMLEDFLGGADPVEGRERFIATVPMGRLSTPEDIAAGRRLLRRRRLELHHPAPCSRSTAGAASEETLAPGAGGAPRCAHPRHPPQHRLAGAGTRRRAADCRPPAGSARGRDDCAHCATRSGIRPSGSPSASLNGPCRQVDGSITIPGMALRFCDKFESGGTAGSWLPNRLSITEWGPMLVIP